jgi:hypothetical protein
VSLAKLPVVLATVLAFSVAGCGAADDDPPAASERFTNTSDILAALRDAGVPCTSPARRPVASVERATSCSAPGTDLLIVEFTNDAQREAWELAVNEDPSKGYVIADEWGVVVDNHAREDRIRRALGQARES